MLFCIDEVRNPAEGPSFMCPPEQIDPTHQYAPLISKCIATKNLRLAALLHSHFIKSALALHPFLSNRIAEVYSKSGSLRNAQKAFDDLPTKNSHSWNTIISSYSRVGLFDHARSLLDKMPNRSLVAFNSLISGFIRHGLPRHSICLFREIQRDSNCIAMDEFTLLGVVGACACLGTLELLRQVHGVALIVSLELNLVVRNALVDAYGKCGNADMAYSIFSRIPEKDAVSWNSMVVCYAWESRLGEARQVFDQMPTRSTLSWSSLISGYVQNGRGNEALELFLQMQEEKFQPNSFTYVSILNVCSELALIEKGKQIHSQCLRTSSGNDCLYNLVLLNSLLDMYCKCGDLKSASTLFDRMPEKDIFSWNSLITGLARNGHENESFFAYDHMLEANIKPNHVTFLGLLSSCTHTGKVSQGLKILEHMVEIHGVRPRSEHFAILIDLLARNNKIEDAAVVIKRAPIKFRSIGMWGAVLGACQVYGNMDLAQKAAEALFELEPESPARYVSLSNVYAAAGQWDDAGRVWRHMGRRGLRKEAACSWIEVKNTRHVFVARDQTHSQAPEIYELVHRLPEQMMEVACMHNDSLDLPDFV